MTEDNDWHAAFATVAGKNRRRHNVRRQPPTKEQEVARLESTIEALAYHRERLVDTVRVPDHVCSEGVTTPDPLTFQLIRTADDVIAQKRAQLQEVRDGGR